MQLVLGRVDRPGGRQFLHNKTRVLVFANSRNIPNLDVRVPSESVDQAAVRVQELTSSLLGVQVTVETQDDLTSLVVMRGRG